MADISMDVIFKALGDPTRLRIFEFLCRQANPVAVDEDGAVRPFVGPTVGDVCCHVTGESRISSTISFHLKELRLAGLIVVERHGKNMICSVDRSTITKMRGYLDDLQVASAGSDCCDGQGNC